MSNVPSIATLRARASQIIVRLGYGQIKAALAATCAAKNAGTPLSPTITGQELVSESQEIINQADSDALAIFLREFMEFIYYGGPPGPGYSGTSTTSVDVVSFGSVTIETQSGLAYAAGGRIRIASQSSPSNWIEGQIDSYSGTTLTFTADLSNGAGIYDDWALMVAGNPTLTTVEKLSAWTESGSYQLVTSVFDADIVLDTATVEWPDGSPGDYTRTDKNNVFLCVDGFTITHSTSGLIVTQAAVTRDSNGRVTSKPALVIA